MEIYNCDYFVKCNTRNQSPLQKNKGTAVTYSVWSNRIIFKNRINHDVKDKELANFWFCRTCKLKPHLHTSWPTYKAWLICSFDWKSTSVQRHLAGSQKFKVLWHGRAHPTDTNQTPLVSTLIIKPPGTPWFFLSSSHQGLTRLTAGMRYSCGPGAHLERHHWWKRGLNRARCSLLDFWILSFIVCSSLWDVSHPNRVIVDN